MVKSEITLPGGAKVSVEGTPQEVEEVVRRLSGAPASHHVRPKGSAPRRRSAQPGTVSGYVVELKEDGVFKQARGLSEVRAALTQEGHVVPLTTLSGVMLNLVKQRHLRRVKEKGVWKYTNR
nr:hypothetical protein [Ferrimicrobium acidiphilum]